MLAEGELPAMISPYIPKPVINGDRRVVRLFPNYEEIELQYFRQTGLFPIMHVTAIRREIVDQYPWVAANLVKAFEESKQIAYKRVANPRMIPLAWVRSAWEKERKFLGADPWIYGLGEVNRKNLQTIIRYCRQQGLIGREVPLEELFADTDLGDSGGSGEEGA